MFVGDERGRVPEVSRLGDVELGQAGPVAAVFADGDGEDALAAPAAEAGGRPGQVQHLAVDRQLEQDVLRVHLLGMEHEHANAQAVAPDDQLDARRDLVAVIAHDQPAARRLADVLEGRSGDDVAEAAVHILLVTRHAGHEQVARHGPVAQRRRLE